MQVTSCFGGEAKRFLSISAPETYLAPGLRCVEKSVELPDSPLREASKGVTGARSNPAAKAAGGKLAGLSTPLGACDWGKPS